MENRHSIEQALLAVTGQASSMDLRTALVFLDSADRSVLDGEFAHFLERRSYVKALAWLCRNPESIHGS